jgi:anti-sigma regulatory factor (Ser/Thr protein kinase)
MDQHELALDATPRSPARARQWISGVVAQDPRYDVGVARLLVSELVTNVVLHARTGMVLRAGTRGWRLRVEVRDGGTGRLGRRLAEAGPDADGGRGWQIVAMMAADWGVHSGPDGVGTVVWFELDAVSADAGWLEEGVGA